MLPGNASHFKRMTIYGGASALAVAALCIPLFGVLGASSVLAGAALGIANTYSVIRLVEALAGFAKSPTEKPGQLPKILTLLVHMFKIAIIFVLLFTLVAARLVDLRGLLVGFTVAVACNIFAGMKGIKDEEETIE